MPNEEGKPPVESEAQSAETEEVSTVEAKAEFLTSPEPEEKLGTPKRRRLRTFWRWFGGIIATLVVVGLIGWWQGWFTALADRWNEATIVIKVREDDTYAIEGVTLLFAGTSHQTDGAGQVVITKVVAGTHKVAISKEGYTPVEKDVTLRRGDNGAMSFSISKEPERLFSIGGRVTDYVTGLALAEAQISVGGQSVKVDSAGAFSVKDIPAGEYKLTASKSGFTTKEQMVQTDSQSEAVVVALVPNGSVLFVSNRSGGKRAVYTAAYDGSNQQELITPIEGTEDFGPAESPNGQVVVFSSTRDKVASSYGSGFLPRLYLINADGTGLRKVSDEVNPTRVEWSSNSRFLYFEAYRDAKLTQFTRRFYDTTKGTLFDLGEESYNLAMSSTGNFALYTVSRTIESDQRVYDLKILDLTNGARRTLVEGIPTYLSGDGITFSPDDSLVYYEVQTGDEGRRRYEVVFANGQKKEITPLGDISRRYVVSPDGSRKAFVEVRDGKTDIFTIAANGGDEKRVTTIGVVSTVPPITWDSTGSYLTFAIVRQGESAMYIVSARGGEIRKIVDFSPDTERIPYY
jgi:Tol biopolymer transport system component